MGKLFFNILATFAEFEVDLIRMRTREGMAVARAQGKLKGRQPKLTPKQQRELKRMYETGEYTISDLGEPRRIELGWTQTELAEHSGVSQADISRIENGRLDARWSTIQRLSEALETTTDAPRRSLANANRGRRTPAIPATRWSPKGPVGAVTRSGS